MMTRRPGQALRPGDVPSGEASVETVAILRDAINSALAMLPDELRVAIILRDVEGLAMLKVSTTRRSLG